MWKKDSPYIPQDSRMWVPLMKESPWVKQVWSWNPLVIQEGLFLGL
jgi:hypothetical protein